MLYRLGLVILLLTITVVDSGTMLIPLGMATLGIALMMIGGANNETDAER